MSLRITRPGLITRSKTGNGLSVQFEQEIDGRWIAEVPERPGVMAYGQTQQEALAKVTQLLEAIGRD
jgi:hypothetical protein